MAEQRQDKVNGAGNKPALAAKKRRKAHDLQPIQTVAQQNGQLKNHASSAGVGISGSSNVSVNHRSRYVSQSQDIQARAYVSRRVNLDSPSSPLSHQKASNLHSQYSIRPTSTYAPPTNRDTMSGSHPYASSAQWNYDNYPTSGSSNWRQDGDEVASNASEEEDLEDYCKGGYHPVEPGQEYKDGRYTVVRKLGWGHFSTVWLARDNLKNRHVALKVVRSATQYKETALDEIKLLEKISTANPSHPGRQHIVSLLDHFEHTGPNGVHICLVFEALGESVLSTIKRYQYRGLPVHIVKQVTKQVLLGLDYLHRECGVIHTDLKPENVLIAIDNTEEVIAETTSNVESMESETPLQWKAAQSPRYPSHLEQRVRPRRFVTRSQPLPSPASVVPKSFSTELARPYNREASESPITMARQGENNPPGSARPSIVREATADNLERDLSDMSLDYHLRKSQLAISRKRFSQELHAIKVKIIDVGNACWVSEHFTNDLQTRQYRAPEVILGAPWGASADVWSMSCMVFELLTGEYLFDPKESRTYRKDEDHIAQMIELLGDFPTQFIKSGMYANEIFNSRGQLRNIHRLTYWGLPAVLKEKYDRPDFAVEADFMLKMLEIVPSRRADAGGMVGHEWLRDTIGMEDVSVGRPVGGRGQGIPGWAEVVKTSRHRR